MLSSRNYIAESIAGMFRHFCS